MKKINFCVLAFALWAFEAHSACYIDPRPDQNCLVSGAEISKVPWSPNVIQRGYLYSSDDVQKSADGCRRFASLLQTECQFKKPVTAVFYDANLKGKGFKEVTLATNAVYDLNAESGMGNSFRDYFRGSLAAPIKLETVATPPPPQIIEAHSLPAVQSFLTRPVGQTMRFFSTCFPQGSIASDGEFMAACIKDSTGRNVLELQRIALGCGSNCISKIQTLLGRFSYNYTLNSEVMNLANVPAITSYTDLQMPLLNQFSTYIDLAMGFSLNQGLGRGWCFPTTGAMALSAVKARSSPYTVTGNVFDLPGCAHVQNGVAYYDCALKIAKAADGMGILNSLRTTGASFNDGLNGLRSISDNTSFQLSASGSANAGTYRVFGYTTENQFSCGSPRNCATMPVPLNCTTVASCTNPALGYAASDIWRGGGMFSSEWTPLWVSKGVPYPLVMDPRLTHILSIETAAPNPLMMNTRNSGHAVAVSTIGAGYFGINDPHGIRYNVVQQDCQTSLNNIVELRSYMLMGIETPTGIKDRLIIGSTARFRRAELFYSTRSNSPGSLGTCIAHAGGTASTLFGSFPFWSVKGQLGIAPWGAGPKWEAPGAFGTGSKTAKLIAEQNKITRPAAFVDPKTIAKCRSNSIKFNTSVFGQDVTMATKSPIDVKLTGFTKVSCAKFDIFKANSPSALVDKPYGNVIVSCQNDSPKIESVECSAVGKIAVPISNGLAYKPWVAASQEFSQPAIVEQCFDNWKVSTVKNSCVCEDPNGTNRVLWNGNKSECLVVCKPGFKPTLYSDGKYRCYQDPGGLKTVGDGTCTYLSIRGTKVAGVFTNNICQPPAEGSVCDFNATVKGTFTRGICVPPHNTPCEVEQFGKKYPGLYLGGNLYCRVAPGLACTYGTGTSAIAGQFDQLGMGCIPRNGVACTYTYQNGTTNVSAAGTYSSGVCIPPNGTACGFPWVNNQVLSGIFAGGRCQPPNGTACDFIESATGKVIAASFNAGSCQPPAGMACQTGVPGNLLSGTYSGRVCMVPNGLPCKFTTSLGSVVNGLTSNNRCLPPAGTECTIAGSTYDRANPKRIFKGATDSSGRCTIPEGTDCTFFGSPPPTFGPSRIVDAKFYADECQSITEGGNCRYGLGGGSTSSGKWFSGICAPADGTRCSSFQYYGALDASQNLKLINYTGSFPGGTTVYRGGKCLPQPGAYCTYFEKTTRSNGVWVYGSGRGGIFNADGKCMLREGESCVAETTLTFGSTTTTSVSPGTFTGGVCMLANGTSCMAKVQNGNMIGDGPGIAKNGKCLPQDGMACSTFWSDLPISGFSSGTYLNGVCQIRDGTQCQARGFAASPVMSFYKGNVCALPEGAACGFIQGSGFPEVLGRIVDGKCYPPDGTRCQLDATDTQSSGVIILGKCLRFAVNSSGAIATPVGVAAPPEGTPCTAYQYASLPNGTIRGGACQPLDGTMCAIEIGLGMTIPAQFKSGVCTPPNGANCYVQNWGSSLPAKFENGVCKPIEGSSCIVETPGTGLGVAGIYRGGICTPRDGANCIAQTPTGMRAGTFRGGLCVSN